MKLVFGESLLCWCCCCSDFLFFSVVKRKTFRKRFSYVDQRASQMYCNICHIEWVYETGPLDGLALVIVCVVFVGAAVVNLVNVSCDAFAFKIVFSTSSWFIRSISSDIFSFKTSTSSRTANIKCDFTRSYRNNKKNEIKQKTKNKIISKIFHRKVSIA